MTKTHQFLKNLLQLRAILHILRFHPDDLIAPGSHLGHQSGGLQHQLTVIGTRVFWDLFSFSFDDKDGLLGGGVAAWGAAALGMGDRGNGSLVSAKCICLCVLGLLPFSWQCRA